MDIIVNIYKDLADESAALNSLIIAHLNTKETLIVSIGKYLLESGGKKIRSLLTILTSKIFGYTGKDNITLAVAIEFLHAATLLHDDVVDDSTIRRFKPTANVTWGSKASILVGDFLLSRSFQLMVNSQSMQAMQSLSQAAAIISEGEVTQFTKLNQRRIITEMEYNEIIMAKTAELFGASCEVGAIIAGQSNRVCKIVQNFGKNLGSIFQIIDDLFDYLGNSSETGKNIGDDFFEGKVTLPLVILYNQLDNHQKFRLKKIIKADSRSQDDFQLVRNLIIEYDIKQHIIDYLANIKQSASKLLEQITVQNIYKDHLVSLLDFCLNRVNSLSLTQTK